MRGDNIRQEGLFSYLSPEARVPKRHPLRAIQAMVDKALAAMHEEFDAIYSHTGRPSIPPEQLLRAVLLQILYTVRSERLLAEQIDYNLLFRWFVGLSMDDPVWDHSTCSRRTSPASSLPAFSTRRGWRTFCRTSTSVWTAP